MSNIKNTFKVKVLGTKGYEGEGVSNHGDCIIVYDEFNKTMILYDCGSEQHAENVIEFMESKGIKQTDIVLSHNDSDHFDGILRLIDEDKVDKVFTTLLLKYVDNILDILDNDSRTRKATKKRILDLYDNIAKLEGNNLKDIYFDESELPVGVSLVGPDEDTMLEAVAKAIKENDIQTSDGSETVVNATSLQIAVTIEGGRGLLLLGDAAVENVICKFSDYWYVQLPHHGKKASAETVLESIENDDDDGTAKHTFLVSDNTGNTNGGSVALMDSPISVGVDIRNTKDGNIEIGMPSYATVKSASRDYGICYGT